MNCRGSLTARHFAEVNELRMRILRVTCRYVAVLVALVQPRIEVSRKTTRRYSARFHAVFQRLEFAEQLRSTGNIESFVDTDNLH